MTFEYLHLLSRLILGVYFVFSGFNHFRNLNNLAGYAQSKNVPVPKLAVLFTGVLLLVGGVTILLGTYVEVGVLALTVFFLPVTFMMHNFWAVQDPHQKMMEMISFMKNLAIWAGVLNLLFVPQPWPFSLGW